MRRYIIQYGDSLWSIAKNELGDPHYWKEIASLNQINDPDLILIGQELQLPDFSSFFSSAISTTDPLIYRSVDSNLQLAEQKATQLPARTHFFFLAIQSDPHTGKIVRKVVFPKGVTDAELVAKIVNPKKYGFFPRDPSSNVSIARHVAQNRTDSRYISASEWPRGAARFDGKPYWIDVQKLKRSGAKIYDANAIEADLDRLAKETTDSKLLKKIEIFRETSRHIDKEVLIEGDVPARTIKDAMEMERATRVAEGLGKSLKVVTGFGMVLSAYDLTQAAKESIETKSIRPLAVETTTLAGGWTGAWLGAKIGGELGALVGIETGPGAIITAATGSLIFGIAGFFGADWLTKFVDEPVVQHEAKKYHGQLHTY